MEKQIDPVAQKLSHHTGIDIPRWYSCKLIWLFYDSIKKQNMYKSLVELPALWIRSTRGIPM